MTRTTPDAVETPARPALLPPRPARASTRRRTARRSLAALVALAAVATAGAPSVITIKPGDTLWDLARAHGTTVSELQRLNDLPGNGMIYAGRTLTVPGGAAPSTAPAAASGERTHRVASGETLSHLALRYGVSQRAISDRNGLVGGRIFAGRTLSIPGSSRGAAPAAAAPSTAAASTTASSTTASSTGGGALGSVAENRRVLAARTHPSKAQVQQMIADTARRHGVDPTLAVAVAYHESGFQQRVVSPVNAIGVMQVLPLTGRNISAQNGLRLDLLDTQDNITAGVLVLKQLLRITGGDIDRALAGYYQGLGSIARQGVLPQTHDYIRIIHIHRARFA